MNLTLEARLVLSSLTMLRESRRSGNESRRQEARYNLEIYQEFTQNILMRSKIAEALAEDEQPPLTAIVS